MQGIKTVLVIHSRRALPATSGAPKRVLALWKHLRSCGFRVELAAPNFGPAYERDIRAFVDRCWTGPSLEEPSSEGALQAGESFLRKMRCSDFDDFAAETGRRVAPVAAISEHVHCSRALAAMPSGTLRILDTMDVQHLRSLVAADGGGDLANRSCSYEEEAAELNAADVILAIQRDERATLQEMCPGKRVLLAEHAHEPIDTRGLCLSNGVLFVGSMYDPNVRGVQQFLKLAWPSILERLPSATLDICGSVCGALPVGAQNVRLRGVVGKLTPYYERASVVVNPVPYGTGLKIKSVEAVCHGKCLVSTEAGVWGMLTNNSLPFYIAGVDEMGEAIPRLLLDKRLRHDYESKAMDCAKTRFSPEAAFRQLVAVIRNHPGPGSGPDLDSHGVKMS